MEYVADYKHLNGSDHKLERVIKREPIVRCRDCKYYEGHYSKCLRPVLVMAGEIYWTDEKDTEGVYCTHAEPDGFCKWGEERQTND